MKTKPIVAIVGRPNVGKSTLFNKLTGKRTAIVEDTPGVTRDRIYGEAEWLNYSFTLIDTGGIEPYSKDIILSQMRRQAELAIETADVIMFLTDINDGVTATDHEIAAMLQKSSKPVVLICNKVDNIGEPPLEFYELYNLGLGDPIAVSSVHGLGLGDALDEVCKYFPSPDDSEEIEDDVTRVAVIGKPNAGKSSLVNRILGEERHIVSNIPGTTRDSVDSHIIYKDKNYTFVDTAGIRKKSKVEENIEYYSVVRALMSIERSDVCIIMIDASEGVTEQDTKIAGYAHEKGRALIIAVNKWDLIEKDGKTMDSFRKDVMDGLSFITYAPIIFI
ncbi:MAG: ribosome biogenesis GTPase Der, partial [Clostridia bacterium]|nr:ribosome biogenesis GTPase Der [Clostridia bacterium]